MEQPNLKYIHDISDRDLDFEKKIINVIKTEFPLEKETYYLNLQAGNYKQVAANVHKLKHKIIILGLEQSYETAVIYENNLKENNTNGKEKFELILKNITNFLETL